VAVSFLSVLRPGIRPAELAASLPVELVGPAITGLASPWADSSHLASVVWSDIFGQPVCRPVTRAEAMAVPAYARARHVITQTVGRITMRGYRGAQLLDPAPPWLERTDGPLSPFHMKLWTADDLLWYGWSCWSRVNAADGYPLSVTRIPWGQWSLEPVTGRVKLDRGDGVHELVDQRAVILIPGPHEGLLAFAQDSIRHASDLQRAAGRAAKHPAAHMVLQQTSGTPLPKESADPNVMTVPKLVESWAQAREGINGGVGYLPPGLEAKELGTFDRHLVLDGRNAAAVDAARMASLPADLVDAATDTSLTYSNSRDNDRRALDYGVGGYMAAISARLTQGDVTPLGTRIAFDVEEWLDQTVPGQDSAETPPPVQPGPPRATVPVPIPAAV
jgi:hypothetical protein